jgi:Fur family transcriptional regulator, peroxide stress response regulator
MPSSITTLLDALQRTGHRITPQRRAICHYMATVSGHPTPSEVYAGVSGVTPTISRATVYNTLNVLAAAGALLQIDLGDEHTHYETNLTPHINLVCRQCRQVTDYEATDLSGEIMAALKHAVHFAPSTVHVQVFGLCAACQHAKD